jgi:hypothetical protein
MTVLRSIKLAVWFARLVLAGAAARANAQAPEPKGPVAKAAPHPRPRARDGYGAGPRDAHAADHLQSQFIFLKSSDCIRNGLQTTTCGDALSFRRDRPLMAQSGHPADCPCRLSADFVAKVENRTTLKISRKSIFVHLRCCFAFQCHYGGP